MSTVLRIIFWVVAVASCWMAIMGENGPVWVLLVLLVSLLIGLGIIFLA